jgi:3-dehydroquinate synthase
MSDLPETVRVNLAERSYDIEIGTGNLAEVGAFLTERAKVSHAVVITDQNVEKPHAEDAAQSIAEEVATADLVVVEPGEESKSISMATALWEKLLQLGTDRKSVIVAVGGGVVGDLAGFVAATYARGIAFFQVPTSLLAQVDSSVGGKVAIDLPEAKNMVGAFLQPRGVLIDTATLQTLPEREYRSSMPRCLTFSKAMRSKSSAAIRTS